MGEGGFIVKNLNTFLNLDRRGNRKMFWDLGMIFVVRLCSKKCFGIIHMNHSSIAIILFIILVIVIAGFIITGKPAGETKTENNAEVEK
jgi:hypothetical protein